jgi:fatty-acyl-CoA synthase
MLGQAVKAMIVRKAGAEVTAEELIGLVADAKGAYQKPRYLEFVDSLTVTDLYKIDKKVMRAQHRG